ncbi:hypothetical protein BJF85_12180 [Saccharomonospora sp. CUA-673]|uniref:hypothetical protein n=1 Tax=Saccharomonospora sp. CUA-673 TaxID=1904969 RepID=UPI000967756A|nr:hypothetical protein [Saccharomonospora sp. CUA-673]OLT48559.1 hypothetical protein BJF85_12180 [Saccharomonospora sp. CUA-673]
MRDHRQPDRSPFEDDQDQEQHPAPPLSPDVPTPPNRDVLGGTEDVPEPPNRDDITPDLPGDQGEGVGRSVREDDDVTHDAGAVEPPD